MKQLLTCVALACACAASFAQAAMCGGVGVDDQNRMKAEAPRHDLMLTFAVSSGAYLSDVDVSISNVKGVVLQQRCGGPLMLVDLPAGAYQVSATPPKGAAQKKSVTVGGKKPASVTFTWP